MFSNAVPQNTTSPVLLADWLKARLNNESFWKDIRPDRSGVLRFHMAVALARNNLQQDAVPFLRQAVSDLKQTSHVDLLHQAQRELGMLLLSRTAGWSEDSERDAEGIKLLTDILASEELAPNQRREAKLSLARAYWMTRNPQQADDLLQELLLEFASLEPPEPLEEAEAILLAAQIWTTSGRASQTIESLRKLLQNHAAELDAWQVFEAKFQLANALGLGDWTTSQNPSQF